MKASLPFQPNNIQYSSSNVVYVNFSGVSLELLEELYIFLRNVYEQDESITFELLCEIFEADLGDEWDLERLSKSCRYLHRVGYFSEAFWIKLVEIP